MMIQAYAATSSKSPLRPFAYDPGELGPHEIELEVTHCGLCHSDLHLIDDAWSSSVYPLVPGHEIVGTVARLGESVTHLAAGQLVGVGWQRSGCLACPTCLAGREHLCAREEGMCIGHHGGFAERARADGRFAFPIPDGLDPAVAAPLLCGGITVFAPLRRYGIDATSSIGVIGIGGLGHLGILIARAFGCEITAFSSSPDKREEALRMGAHHFVSSTDARAIRERAGKLDLVLSTVHARLDWTTYLGTLRPGGTLCFLGAFPGLLQLPPAALLLEQKTVTASRTGGRAAMGELLRFAAARRLSPRIQVLPMVELNAAIAILRDNRARYRLVLER